LERKALVSLSTVVMDIDGKDWSHSLTLSLKENENKQTQITLLEAPLIFNVSHTFTITKRRKLGSCMGVHQIVIVAP